MKYVVSVSKTYIHRGKHNHKSNTKKRWFIYYYEDGKFKSERVTWIQAMYYKIIKRRRIKYICTQCGEWFIGFVFSAKQKIECPNCS